MDCISFWVWIGSGVFIVPLLAFLKALPGVGVYVERYAMWVAPILAALAPQIAQVFTGYCAVIDPALWAFIYAGAVYLVSQLAYWASKKAGLKV